MAVPGIEGPAFDAGAGFAGVLAFVEDVSSEYGKVVI
jgi:hypothetical protein